MGLVCKICPIHKICFIYANLCLFNNRFIAGDCLGFIFFLANYIYIYICCRNDSASIVLCMQNIFNEQNTWSQINHSEENDQILIILSNYWKQNKNNLHNNATMIMQCYAVSSCMFHSRLNHFVVVVFLVHLIEMCLVRKLIFHWPDVFVPTQFHIRLSQYPFSSPISTLFTHSTVWIGAYFIFSRNLFSTPSQSAVCSTVNYLVLCRVTSWIFNAIFPPSHLKVARIPENFTLSFHVPCWEKNNTHLHL